MENEVTQSAYIFGDYSVFTQSGINNEGRLFYIWPKTSPVDGFAAEWRTGHLISRVPRQNQSRIGPAGRCAGCLRRCSDSTNTMISRAESVFQELSDVR